MATVVRVAEGGDAAARSRRWLIAISVALGALLEIVDTSIVNVAIPQMQASLGVTLSEVGWIVTSYAIANVIILPLSAWLGDRFGKTRFFVFSLVAFIAASLLCGVAQTLPQLVCARVLQGLFGGGLLAKAQSILFETFPKEEQAAAQALFGIVAIAGPAIGPTLGGYIVTNLDWRWIFFINLPIGVVAVIMSVTFLPKDEAPSATGAVDWTSLALLAAGLGAGQTLLEEGYAHDWLESGLVRGCAVVTVVSLVWFVYRQLRSSNPVVDLAVLRHRSLAAGCVLSAAIGMGLYGALFAVPIFAQTSLHYTSQQTGMLLLPGALASAATMPVAARLLRKYDPRVLIGIGAAIVVSSMLALARLNPNTSEAGLFWPLIVRGVGTVLMFLPMSMAALGSVPVKEVSKATGLYNLTRQLGGSVGIAILTTVLASRQAFHRGVLVEKLGVADPSVIARVDALTAGFVAKGQPFADAHRAALGVLDGAVSGQAAVMSFADTFWIVAIVFVATMPLVFLLGKGGRRGAPAAAH